jgi:hypothetical protein
MGRCMCESCIEIDKRIEKLRQSLRSTADPLESERISRLIAELYRDRVRLHKNPER